MPGELPHPKPRIIPGHGIVDHLRAGAVEGALVLVP